MRPRLGLLIACLAGFAAVPAGAVEIKEVTTPLGLKAWHVEAKSTRGVGLSFSFPAGSGCSMSATPSPASTTRIQSRIRTCFRRLAGGADSSGTVRFRLRLGVALH